MSAANSPEGYIASANNAVAGADYPYLITTDWDYGYRAARVVELIETAPGPIDSAYIQSMQGDDRNLSFDFTLPLLAGLELSDAQEIQARELLAAWDGQQRMDSPEAVLYEAFWKNLVVMTFSDDLPEEQQPEGGSRWFEVVRNISAQPESGWWDDKSTPKVETRDDIYQLAFSAAVKETRASQGSDPAGWAWGDLHTITFRNQTLGEWGSGRSKPSSTAGRFPPRRRVRSSTPRGGISRSLPGHLAAVDAHDRRPGQPGRLPGDPHHRAVGACLPPQLHRYDRPVAQHPVPPHGLGHGQDPGGGPAPPEFEAVR